MYRRVAIGVPALLLILPVGVDACICVSPRSAQPRGAVFVGTAVELVRRVSDPNVGTRRDVRFVVHASWHGPMQDTVTVSSTLTGDCGANYLLGLTYLVVGDYDGRMAITGACDQVRRVSADDDLPEPAWVSAPAGERSFDHSVIEVGQPPPEGEDGWVFLFLEPRTIAVREDRSGVHVQMAQDTVRRRSVAVLR